MMKSIKSGIIVFILLLSIVSCKRDYMDKGYIGPAVRLASANFSATGFGITPGCPNNFAIALSYPSFIVTMNEDVTWTMVVTGQRSGAIKTITMTSMGFPYDSIWKGDHDGINYFETGEQINAVLTVAGWNSSLKTSFTLNGAQPWSNSKIPTVLLTPHTDFETIIPVGKDSVTLPNAWAYAAFDLQTVKGTVSYRYVPVLSPIASVIQQNSIIAAPEGQCFGRLSGSFSSFTAAPNGVFIDGVQCRTNWGTGQNKMMQSYKFSHTIGDGINPDSIYLNIFVRGIDNLPPGYQPHATLNFEVDEDDDGLPATAANCNQNTGDNWCPCNEDGWFLKIPITHTGWKLFSCKYSDLYQNEDFKNGGNGNRIIEPGKVCRAQIGLNANIPYAPCQADFDMACITYGAPLNPNAPFWVH